MTRYRKKPEEVEARQVPASDPQGSFLKWTRGRRPHVRVVFIDQSPDVSWCMVEQLGDFPFHAYPGDYIVFHKNGRAEKVRRYVFEEEYERCG